MGGLLPGSERCEGSQSVGRQEMQSVEAKALQLTPAISRRAHNLDPIQVSRMKATLFAVGCMAFVREPCD